MNLHSGMLAGKTRAMSVRLSSLPSDGADCAKAATCILIKCSVSTCYDEALKLCDDQCVTHCFHKAGGVRHKAHARHAAQVDGHRAACRNEVCHLLLHMGAEAVDSLRAEAEQLRPQYELVTSAIAATSAACNIMP
jgi:hypothetical protein